MNQNSVTILDSTLRDGAQGIGISFSVEDKLSIVKLLDKLGVAYIEAGNPTSNPKDIEFFERLKEIKLENSKISAFSSTRRKNIDVNEDTSMKSLIAVNTPVCTIFGKSSKFHVENVLETSLEENLKMIEDSCRFVKENGKELIYDAEHFFDGFKEDSTYAIGTLKAATKGGADIICLCDTNGGSFPHEIHEIIEAVKREISAPIGIHTHDDAGLAVASSIEAVLTGAVHVQGTLIGFGERCGNANLSTIIPDLQLKLGISCIPDKKLKLLRRTSKEIAAISNVDISQSLPYIGRYAFAHKAGMHADGVLKNTKSFEHVDPEAVGNTRRFPTSEISGKSIILEKIQMIFPEVKIDSNEAQRVLDEIKRQEQLGYQFEGADASFEILVRRLINPFSHFFELIHYNISTVYSETGFTGASATVKVRVGGKVQLMAAEGNGPVNALDTAIRNALEVFYPYLSKVKLIDYKVRVLESKNATASGVRVLMTSTDGENTYTTVGVSEDVVAASWKALEDSIDYVLVKNSEEK